MENQLEVEVSLDNGFVYKAFVEDVLTNQLEVSFEANWKSPSLIEFNKIRFPPENSDVGFKKNDLVEIRLNDSSAKVDYWRLAILSELDLNTGRWTVHFFTQCSDAKLTGVKLSDIRHVNEKSCIGQCTLTKVEIEIPEELRNIAANPDVHAKFREQVNADVCKFIPDKNILRCISRQGEITRKKVGLLKGLHLQHLNDELEETCDIDNENFHEEFEVSQDLMGLALGKKYANIKNARQIKDIISIELIKDTLRIRIVGKTAEAVKAARDMVEFLEYHMTFPRYLAEEILENDGKIMKEIVEESGLVRIESGEEDELSEDPEYPIVFVGNPSCIENAKALLEYQLKLAERKLKKKVVSRIEPVVEIPPNIIVERVPIKKDLKGLAIGKNHVNLKKAENLPGIVKIEIPKEMPMFLIHAQNDEAAKAARRILEYDEDTVEVDKNSLGKIIGKNGITIKKIESLNEGVQVDIPSRVIQSNLTTNDKVIITVRGPVDGVSVAVDLIKRAEFFGHL